VSFLVAILRFFFDLVIILIYLQAAKFTKLLQLTLEEIYDSQLEEFIVGLTLNNHGTNFL